MIIYNAPCVTRVQSERKAWLFIMTMEKTILICEDSIEGIFSGIYEAYARKYVHSQTSLQIGETENYELFAEYKQIAAEEEKAKKVSRTIIREFGEETYLTFCEALATQDLEKGNAIYHVLVDGLRTKNNRIMENFAVADVNKVFELCRYTKNEIQHLKGFLRFQELEKGVLFARIGPRNNILTFLAPHFADRLPNENFIIYDDTRNLCVVHPCQKEWFLMSADNLQEEETRNYSQVEVAYQELFTFFCQKIGIRERKNIALQTQMLPLHFQKYMSEFNDKVYK